MAVAFDAVSNVAAGTGDLSWTHTPTGTPRGVRVDIVENGGTNGVTAVTYGGISMELVAVNAKTSGEAGTVITYFLGKSIPTGAQTVSVTVGDAVSKRAVAITVTASSDTCWISVDASLASDSVTNPSSTLSLLGKTCFVSLALHSGQGAATGITPLTGWTSRLEHDFGAQMGGWYTYNTVASSDVACGWTQTADDAVMVALAITEAPIAVDLSSVGVTESASVTVVYDSRALPILITETSRLAVTFSVSDSCTVQCGTESPALLLTVPSTDSLAVQFSDVGAAILTSALSLSVTDGLTVVLNTESSRISSVSVSASDVLIIGMSESDQVVNTIAGATVISVIDSCVIQGADVISNLQVFTGSSQNFLVSDSLKVQLNGSGVTPVQKTATDSASITIDEPTSQDGAFSVLDVAVVGISESASVNTGSLTAFFATSDQATVQASESTSLVSNTILSASDSIRIQTPEDVPDVAIVIVATDSVGIIANEPSDQSTQIGVTESIKIQLTGEVSQIGGLLTFTVTDILTAQLSESTTQGTTVVSASDSVRVVASELLTNSASVSASDSLRVVSSESFLLFKDITATESLAVQCGDISSPIFNNFVAITAADTCAVNISDATTQLISFLNQLSVTDTLITQSIESVTAQTVSTFAIEQLPIQLNDVPDIFYATSVSDSFKIGTTEAGLAIPIVSVNVSTFADDSLSFFSDSSATIAVDYEAIDKYAVDGCVVHGSEDLVMRTGYFTDDTDSIECTELATQTVVLNATLETWNGCTAVEHNRHKPKPWKYIVTDRSNW